MGLDGGLEFGAMVGSGVVGVMVGVRDILRLDQAVKTVGTMTTCSEERAFYVPVEHTVS